MKYRTGLSVASGTTEGYVDFSVRDRYLTSIQIQEEHTYPMYVRVEYYENEQDTFPEILFANWLRATSGYFNAPNLIFNKPVDEKGIVRVNFLNQSGVTITPMVTTYYHAFPTGQTNYYNPEVHRGIWAVSAMWERKTDAGTIGVYVTPTAGSWFELVEGRITAGMSAAEDVAINVVDENLVVIKSLVEINTTTGGAEFPSYSVLSDDAAATAESTGKGEDVLRITYPDRLMFSVSSCAATDDITVTMRCRLKDIIPTVSFADAKSGVQAGYANVMSKVI